jgi:hypothetical protein
MKDGNNLNTNFNKDSPLVIGKAGGCHDFEGFIDEVCYFFYLLARG